MCTKSQYIIKRRLIIYVQNGCLGSVTDTAWLGMGVQGVQVWESWAQFQGTPSFQDVNFK